MTLPFTPTPEQRKTVSSMSGFGVPQESIATVIGIDPKTLREHFRTELDLGIAKAQATMAQSLFSRAQTSDTLGIFWAKVNLGWKDRVEQQPITNVITIQGGLPDTIPE